MNLNIFKVAFILNFLFLVLQIPMVFKIRKALMIYRPRIFQQISRLLILLPDSETELVYGEIFDCLMLFRLIRIGLTRNVDHQEYVSYNICGVQHQTLLSKYQCNKFVDECDADFTPAYSHIGFTRKSNDLKLTFLLGFMVF